MNSPNVSKPAMTLRSRLLRPVVAVIAAAALFVSASAYAEPPGSTLAQTQHMQDSGKAKSHARGKRSKKHARTHRTSAKKGQHAKKGAKAKVKAHGKTSKKRSTRRSHRATQPESKNLQTFSPAASK